MLRGSQFDEPPPAREIEAELDWSGFYVGGGVGTSRTEFTPAGTGLLVPYLNLNSRLQLDQRYSMSPFSQFRTANDSGVNFSGFTGYNFRFGDVILGVEADYTKLDHRYDVFPTRLLSDLVIRFAAAQRSGDGPANPAGLRLGPPAHGLHDGPADAVRHRRLRRRARQYSAGGGFEEPSGLIAPTAVREKDRYMYGLTAGLGMEALLTQNVFLRAEYLFTRFDSFEGTSVDINNVRVGAGLKF